MAPLFGALKNLRRASKASFRTPEASGESSSEADAGSNGTGPTSGSVTPASIISTHSSDAATAVSLQPSLVRDDDGPYIATKRPSMPNTPSMPSMPSMPEIPNMSPTPVLPKSRRTISSHHSGSGNPNRYSMGPMASSLSIPSSAVKGKGKYAPRITNMEDRAFVHQKVIEIRGEIGDPNDPNLRPINGTVTISHTDNQMPPLEFPVCASRFKALVTLVPGPNRLRAEFVGHKIPDDTERNITNFGCHYMPTSNAPPLQLAILVAKDSPRTFDSIPSRIDREGNGLETAIRKFRMAAYLWQAFTAEEMLRLDKLLDPSAPRPRCRSFRFEEEWTAGTSNGRDRDNGTMRSEARVHVVELDKTVAEIRDLGIAQQNEKATDRGGLFPIATEALRNYFRPQSGQKIYVAAMILDSHWDQKAGVITGHAALGSGGPDIALGLFGSHLLWSYPTCFEEVDACFTDCNQTDTNLVGNDCGDAGSSWEACNLGIGAHLHEVGHAFGLPHRPSGVMLRDYVRLHRSFVSREAYSTRTKEKGGPVAAGKAEECTWHPLDYLQLRTHPCFRTTLDPVSNEPGVAAWPAADGTSSVVFTAPSGLSHVEIFAAGSEERVCGWIAFESNTYRASISEKELRQRLSSSSSPGPALSPSTALKVRVRSLVGGQFETDDFASLAAKDTSSLKVHGASFCRGGKLGLSNLPDTKPSEVVLASVFDRKKLLRHVVVYHGSFLNGIEFVFDNNERQLFGNQGGKPGGDVFEMDLRRGEQILGFKVKSGHWIDAIQIVTTLNSRTSPWYGGNSPAVHPTSLLPPQGFQFCGVSGTCGPGSWVDGFAVVFRRG